jgi:hypothetical protein
MYLNLSQRNLFLLWNVLLQWALIWCRSTTCVRVSCYQYCSRMCWLRSGTYSCVPATSTVVGCADWEVERTPMSVCPATSTVVGCADWEVERTPTTLSICVGTQQSHSTLHSIHYCLQMFSANMALRCGLLNSVSVVVTLLTGKNYCTMSTFISVHFFITMCPSAIKLTSILVCNYWRKPTWLSHITLQ